MHIPSPNPRIAALARVEEALAVIRQTARPVEPQKLALGEASGGVLAADICAETDMPPHPLAYRDGWAVRAEDVVGASAYNPAFLTQPEFLSAGDALPEGADAILRPEALTQTGPMAEITEDAAPGDGVRFAGQDAEAARVLIAAGTQIQAHHLALAAACGMNEIAVRRARIRLVLASRHAPPWAGLAKSWLEAAGAEVETVGPLIGRSELSLAFGAQDTDAIIGIGGTGFGSADCTVAALADMGDLLWRGLALGSAETTSFGVAGSVPVLLLPARPDALIAGLLMLGLPLAQALCDRSAPAMPAFAQLSESVSSAIGLTEIFLLVSGRPVPLTEAGFDMMGTAEAWFAVPPGSEGFAAAAMVQIHTFAPR